MHCYLFSQFHECYVLSVSLQWAEWVPPIKFIQSVQNMNMGIGIMYDSVLYVATVYRRNHHFQRPKTFQISSTLQHLILA